jgi:hypothetical protein
MRSRATAPLLGLATLALLAGCGPDTQRTFGFTRDAPDEFQVTTRAPLSMPPALGQLPVPRPGAVRPQELTVRDQAEATLVPGAVLTQDSAVGRPSAGESALLSQAGRPAGGDIRQRVDEESLKLSRDDRNFVDRLMFWREQEQPGVPVDARREAQRLRENAALGRSAGEGETPIIQRKKKALLEGIF